jgi:hypothetical protein
VIRWNKEESKYPYTGQASVLWGNKVIKKTDYTKNGG